MTSSSSNVKISQFLCLITTGFLADDQKKTQTHLVVIKLSSGILYTNLTFFQVLKILLKNVNKYNLQQEAH